MPEAEFLPHIANIARSRQLKRHERLWREPSMSKNSENLPEGAPASCEGRPYDTMARPSPRVLRGYPSRLHARSPYLNRFSKRELLTTLTLDSAMAAPARAGARMPPAASGIMMQL